MDILEYLIILVLGIITTITTILGIRRKPGIPRPNPIEQPTEILGIPEVPVIDEPGIDDHEIKAKFDEIAARPFDVENYNCVHKSVDFGNYLLDRGCQGVAIVQIPHTSQNYSHALIQWKDKYFDPTNNPPYYAVDKDQYIQALKAIGFGDMRITSTYYKGWYDFYKYGKVS